jgi:hypothetical protein
VAAQAEGEEAEKLQVREGHRSVVVGEAGEELLLMHPEESGALLVDRDVLAFLRPRVELEYSETRNAAQVGLNHLAVVGERIERLHPNQCCIRLQPNQCCIRVSAVILRSIVRLQQVHHSVQG